MVRQQAVNLPTCRFDSCLHSQTLLVATVRMSQQAVNLSIRGCNSHPATHIRKYKGCLEQ